MQFKNPESPPGAPPPTANPLFNVMEADFTIVAVPDGTIFKVRRADMETGSAVFKDMFSSCDDDLTQSSQNTQEVEIHERPEIFALFLRLLHEPRTSQAQTPKPQPTSRPMNENDDVWLETATVTDSGSQSNVSLISLKTLLPECIPIPMLRPLFDLADKYDIIPELHGILEDHLTRNAPDYPLEVYSMASSLGLESVIVTASSHLVSRPLDTYTMQEISILPSVQAYHRLTLLHAYRIKKLREVLMAEPVFPHGYRMCPKHGQVTQELWQMRKMNILPYIVANTDVAEEMKTVFGSVEKCEACHEGCRIAIEMLKYKCGKVPRTYDRVPGTSWPASEGL